MGEMKRQRVALESLANAIGGLGIIPIDLLSAVRADTGAPLAVFADGASAVPGVQITDAKVFGVRWNNHATPTEVALNVLLPKDLDTDENVYFRALASKTGATVGDATSITLAAYNIVPAALHDADANYGGATNALTGNATAKTVALLSRTLAAANLPDPTGGAAVSLVFGPTDGTLGTDDFVLHSVWLEYTRKYIAAS